jgi:cytidine deaminase
MAPLDQALFEAAQRVRAHAHVPYSKFAVGAAVLADDGQIYAGCNVENAAYPQGCCAEASAISQMIGQGAKRITRVFVVGPGTEPVTPCGGCRQRLREFAARDVPITCLGEDGAPLHTTLGALLPHSFGPEFLP